MYASELRTYVLGGVVCVLLGAGTGFGWHYFADSASGRAAVATTQLAQQDASPQPLSSNPPAAAESSALNAPPFPGLSRYPQPAAYNGSAATAVKGVEGNSRHKLRKAVSERDLRSRSSDS